MKKRFWVLLLAVIFLSSCTVYEYAEPKQYDNKDYTAETAGIRLEDDFYGYVNFDFLWNSAIPSDMHSYGTLEILSAETDEDITQEMIGIAESNEIYPTNSDEQKIHDFYMQYIDTEAREKMGIKPIENALSAIRNADNIDEFIGVCGMLYLDYGCSVIITPAVSEDIYNPEKYVLYFYPMDFVYTANELLYIANIDIEMQKYIEETLTLYNSSDNRRAAYDTVTMLTEIAESTSDISAMEIKDIYNSYDNNSLNVLFGGADTEKFKTAYGIGKVSTVIIPDILQAEKISIFLNDEYLDEWKSYAIFKLFSDYRDYLPSEYSTLPEQPNMPIEKKAINAVKTELSEELGNIYEKKYYNASAAEKAEEMTFDIIDAYKNAILKSDMVSEAEKEKLILKLEKMDVNIGIPDEKFLSTSVINGGILESCISIRKNAVEENLSLYGTSVSHKWEMTSYTVNAYYSSKDNSINIPLAMLNKPVFDTDAGYYENLGKLGAVIAHEISHAFDSNGVKYDENGCYNPDWIGMYGKERLQKVEKSFSEYFGNAKIMDVYKIDRELTLNENIADTAGVYVISTMTDNKEDLKVIYENYAVLWASLSYDTDIINSLYDDVHSPAEIRVNKVLSTLDSFYYAYDINKNDEMYVPFENRPRVW